jgi:hypothetical protein
LLRPTTEEKKIITSPNFTEKTEKRKKKKREKSEKRPLFPQRYQLATQLHSLCLLIFLVDPRGSAVRTALSLHPRSFPQNGYLRASFPPSRSSQGYPPFRWGGRQYFSSSTAAEAVSGLPPFSHLPTTTFVVATNAIPESDGVPEQWRG